MVDDLKNWIGLVTFERISAGTNILPDEMHGACGWMGCTASKEDDVLPVLEEDLAFHGLKLLEVADVKEVFDLDDVFGVDDHLARNFNAIEPGKRTVWGTIHMYRAEGEA